MWHATSPAASGTEDARDELGATGALGTDSPTARATEPATRGPGAVAAERALHALEHARQERDTARDASTGTAAINPSVPEPEHTERPTTNQPATEPQAAADVPCGVACRGERIRAAVPLQPPSGYTVTFEGPRDGLLGYTHSSPRREIVIYLRDTLTDEQTIATLLHEIGHAWDFQGLNLHGNRGRQAWAEMRGFPWLGTSGWFGLSCTMCTDYSVGAGDLAEAVHACWAPGYDRFRSKLAGPPSDAQCAWLRDVIG